MVIRKKETAAPALLDDKEAVAAAAERAAASERARRFWDAEFSREGSIAEWLLPYARWAPLLRSILPPLPSARVLVVGCGLSSLPFDLAADGFGHVLATDISKVAVDRMQMMQQQQQTAAAVEFAVADIFSMPQVPSGAFDAVVDKATLDSVLFRQPSYARRSLATIAFAEIGRVLRPDTGVYFVVTPRMRFKLFVPGLPRWRRVLFQAVSPADGQGLTIIHRQDGGGQPDRRGVVYVHAFRPPLTA